MNEETVFHPLKTESIFNAFDVLLLLLLLYFFLFFKWLFFPSKQIKIMLNVQLILNINIEGKACSHHTV